MDFWIINICLVFFLCVLFSGIVIPQILLIAFRRQLFDVPDERKIHHCSVPRLGGFAFKPVIFFSIALLLGVNQALGYQQMLLEIKNSELAFAFGLCSIMMLYLVGMADDLVGVRYRAKFCIQILCGVMLIVGGIWIDNLHGVLGIYTLPWWIGYPLTILVIVFIINAINLIDGIDGLASSLCSIACLFYGVNFFMFHQYMYALLAFATLGVLVPFFYYNVFGKAELGRKIFMGDTGSLTIGMMLCFLSIKLALCAPIESMGVPHPMVLAFAPLLVPCLDVLGVCFQRLRDGRNLFLPDKNHIHHKLLALGMRQRNAMITIVSVSVLLTLANVLLSKYININWILAGNALAWIGMNIGLASRIRKKGLVPESNQTGKSTEKE